MDTTCTTVHVDDSYTTHPNGLSIAAMPNCVTLSLQVPPRASKKKPPTNDTTNPGMMGQGASQHLTSSTAVAIVCSIVSSCSCYRRTPEGTRIASPGTVPRQPATHRDQVLWTSAERGGVCFVV